LRPWDAPGGCFFRRSSAAKSGILPLEPHGSFAWEDSYVAPDRRGRRLYRKDLFANGLCNLQGSFIPFAATRAERLAAGDPRPSLEERHPDKQTYVSAIEAAARDLVASGLLLPEDAEMLVAKVRAEGVRKAP